MTNKTTDGGLEFTITNVPAMSPWGKVTILIKNPAEPADPGFEVVIYTQLDAQTNKGEYVHSKKK